MIPYFSLENIQLGPITIQVWGAFVAFGILIATYTSAKFFKKQGGLGKEIYDVAFWIIISAFIFARIFHVFLYDPGFYLTNPEQIIAFWHGGFSIMGGFVGSIIAFLLMKLDWQTYVDPLIYGLPLGIGCGRIGCFLIHDHPGTLTDFFLGVRQSDGVIRHDHGLYLSINGFILALIFFYLSKRKWHKGFYAQVFLVWYGIVRFFLDFYRLIDVKYWGLTPAQYISILMFISGVAWWYYSKNKKYENNVT